MTTPSDIEVADNLDLNEKLWLKIIIVINKNTFTSLALWKHHVNLLLQTKLSIRKFGSSLIGANNGLLALMEILTYGSKTLQ